MKQESRFRYQRDQMEDVFRAVGNGVPVGTHVEETDLQCAILALQDAATDYIDATATSDLLPDRTHLAEKRRQQLEQLQAVRELLSPNEGLAAELDHGKTSLLLAGSSPAKVVCRLFLDGAITYDDVEQHFAAAAIEKLFERTEWDHDLARKDDRKREFRREYLLVVAATWARLIGRPLSECTISAVDGTPMITFVRAAVDPVLAKTGDELGNERLKQILRGIVCDAGGSTSVMDASENQSLVF